MMLAGPNVIDLELMSRKLLWHTAVFTPKIGTLPNQFSERAPHVYS